MKKIILLLISILIISCTVISVDKVEETSKFSNFVNQTAINIVRSKYLRDQIFESDSKTQFVRETDYISEYPYEDEEILKTDKFYISILKNIKNKNKENKNKKLAIIINGGAFYHSLKNSHKKLYGSILNNLENNDFDMMLIQYTVMPYKNYPTQLNEIMAAWKYILKQGYREDNIIMLGDSSGGNLILAHNLILRDNNMKLPRIIVLLSPWTDLTNTTESRTFNKYRDIVMGDIQNSDKSQRPDKFINNKYGTNDNLKNPYISPIFGDYHGFRTVIIEVGSFEVLWDDSYKIYKNMLKNNVDVHFKDYPGMFHVFQFLPISPETIASKKRIANIIEETFNEKK